jgi:hypothetical protein
MRDNPDEKIIEDWECSTQSNPVIDKDKLISHIIGWLNSNIDKNNFEDYPEFQEMLAQDSADLKEKIELFMEGVDEF